MIFGRRARPSRESQTRDWARCVIRSGLLSSGEVIAEISAVIASDLPDLGEPTPIAEQWVAEERADWLRDAARWERPTDFDRIQATFVELRVRGYLVLEGCADHWAARDALRANPSARGVLWFVPADVWHAIDEPMLEVNLWHPSTANAGAGDDLTREVLQLLKENEIHAVFDEGRIEVAALWQHKPDV